MDSTGLLELLDEQKKIEEMRAQVEASFGEKLNELLAPLGYRAERIAATNGTVAIPARGDEVPAVVEAPTRRIVRQETILVAPRIRRTPGKFVCPKCDRAFKFPPGLGRHMRAAHGKKK